MKEGVAYQIKLLLLPLHIFGHFTLSNFNVPIKTKLGEKTTIYKCMSPFLIGFRPVDLVYGRDRTEIEHCLFGLANRLKIL